MLGIVGRNERDGDKKEEEWKMGGSEEKRRNEVDNEERIFHST